MREILTATREIRAAITLFRKRIRALGGNATRKEWVFPNGERDDLATYSIKTQHGDLLVGLPDKWTNRVPHLFCLARDGRALSPDVEVNIPTSLNRNVSGAYLREGKSIWLCTRGDFTAYRGKISRQVSFSHFDKWLVDVQDTDRVTQVIPVAALDSKTLDADLAEFVMSVIELKDTHKAGADDVAVGDAHWGEGDEFEGKKNKTTTADTVTFEYLHGPLCNGLQYALRSLLKGDRSFGVKRNRNVDSAVVHLNSDVARLIFEVKTSSDFSGQLYSAIGQLFHYRHKFGDPKTHLFLVLPRTHSEQAGRVSDFFSTLGIDVLLGEGRMFTDIGGRPLKAIIDARLRA